jgi:flagella basal body P-ring formation protein FlgA
MVKEFRVLARISVEVFVPVAKNQMRRKSLIRENDFEQRWVELPKSNNKFISELTKLNGYVLKSNIRLGEPVRIGQLKKPLTVSRGDIVHLKMKLNGIEINGKAKILKEGSAGEIVDAEYIGTRKKIRVEIVNKKLVKYRL